jgi:hypothetical protein
VPGLRWAAPQAVGVSGRHHTTGGVSTGGRVCRENGRVRRLTRPHRLWCPRAKATTGGVSAADSVCKAYMFQGETPPVFQLGTFRAKRTGHQGKAPLAQTGGGTMFAPSARTKKRTGRQGKERAKGTEPRRSPPTASTRGANARFVPMFALQGTCQATFSRDPSPEGIGYGFGECRKFGNCKPDDTLDVELNIQPKCKVESAKCWGRGVWGVGENFRSCGGMLKCVSMFPMAENIAVRLGPGNYRRIALRAGLSNFHVSRVLRGSRGCSFDIACRIADAAGVTMDDLRRWVAPTASQRRTRKTRMDIEREDADANG